MGLLQHLSCPSEAQVLELPTSNQGSCVATSLQASGSPRPVHWRMCCDKGPRSAAPALCTARPSQRSPTAQAESIGHGRQCTHTHKWILLPLHSSTVICSRDFQSPAAHTKAFAMGQQLERASFLAKMMSAGHT